MRDEAKEDLLQQREMLLKEISELEEQRLAYQEAQRESDYHARREQLRSLGRDVGVNVLANVIAAAIIYLFAAAVGLLPRSAPTATAALVILMLSVMALVEVSAKWHKGRNRLGRLHNYYVAAADLIIGLTFIILGPRIASSTPADIVFIMFGSLALLLGVLSGYKTFIYSDKQ